MTQPVMLPLWALVLLVVFAAVTFASHFLFPSVRWFLRRRMERVVARLNRRLPRPIEPFKLARRTDMIQRLLYDPEVTRAVVEHAHAEGLREDVAFEQARRYAREIVPGFSATLYFALGGRVARWMTRAFYEIRVEGDVAGDLSHVPEDACVIFVMNHRSNMDYVLVTWLVAPATALSYAVGEWARVWPLTPLIRMLGAYFIRRKSRNVLYRRVLARYVQMATRGGVTQAFFPEGRLSLTGHLGDPRLGLLSYVMDEDAEPGRPVMFVPVALNYDRVLEDRILLGAKDGRSFRVPWARIIWTSLGQLVQRLTRRFRGFGTAAVSFGHPVRLTDWGGSVEGLGEELMSRIAARVPALPVPLVCHLLQDGPHDLPARLQALMAQLEAAGVPLPESDPAQAMARARDLLRTRGIIDDSGAVVAGAEPLIHYYAASIAHHLPEAS